MQRLPQLDIIRGVAILGILLMNIFSFAYPIDIAANLVWHQAGVSSLDTTLYNLQTLFLSGRFITLFNLLFGVSMLLILQHYGLAYLQRRLTWLAVFGALHGVLLWSGDILLWYALAGLIVLKRGYLLLDYAELWRKALRFFAISLVMPAVYVLYLLLADAEPSVPLNAEMLEAEQQLWQGAYVDLIIQNALNALLMLFAFILSLYWLVAALMLLGAALYKRGWFSAGFSSLTNRILFLGALVISGITVLLDHATGYAYGLNSTLPWEPVAMLMMALSFASVLVKQSENRGLNQWLAPCGKMAFTLYISQTLLMVMLFRFIKPEWYAMLERPELLAIAMTVIALQMLFSRWYFSYFKQGPLEWCWRALSRKPAITD